MSNLAHAGDDHPEAARKHAHDARVLLTAERYDGAAYLAGYAVECAVKALVLHDKTFDPATGATDTAALALWHRTLRTGYRHDLVRLLGLALGARGARYAGFLPDPATTPPPDVARTWSETLRYRPAGEVTVERAASYVEWAGLAELAIAQMTLDGVL